MMVKEIKEKRMSNHKIEVSLKQINKGKVLAAGRFTVDDLIQVNCTVMEGKDNVPFLSLPGAKGSNGKWYNNVFITSKELYKEVSTAVISEYRTLAQGEGSTQTQQETSGSNESDDYPF